jgi:hypothetical protein
VVSLPVIGEVETWTIIAECECELGRLQQQNERLGKTTHCAPRSCYLPGSGHCLTVLPNQQLQLQQSFPSLPASAMAFMHRMESRHSFACDSWWRFA